jgi:hypothetical protein
MFHKGKVGYDYLRELLQIEHIGWIAEWPSGTWLEKCSDQGTIVQMRRMGAHKATRI